MQAQNYRLEVTGSLYEANCLGLNPHQVDDLLNKRKKSRTWQSMGEPLIRDTVISGFVFYKQEAFFDLHYQETPVLGAVDSWLKELMESEFEPASVPTYSSNQCWLVYEKWSDDGCLALALDSAFDHAKLEIKADLVELPTNELRCVAELYYDGQFLNFESSNPCREETYVFSPKYGITFL